MSDHITYDHPRTFCYIVCEHLCRAGLKIKVEDGSASLIMSCEGARCVVSHSKFSTRDRIECFIELCKLVARKIGINISLSDDWKSKMPKNKDGGHESYYDYESFFKEFTNYKNEEWKNRGFKFPTGK